ncbi:MAG: recombinase family protein, partial [Clostridiales bacterium]|nr:recombinase family protein [Clostridiales bacterium]
MASKRAKCYIYMRVSTAMQVEGYSLEAQKDRLTKFAGFQHMEVVREYCDAGKSGKSITGRPEFSQMLQDVADGRDDVDYILVFKLSRFGRNAADVLNSLQYIQDFGVNLICVEDGIDSSKDSGKLTITVLSAVAEIERENILVQTMEGRKQKAREGKWNGGQAPYGYRVDSKNSTLVIEPDEAEIVKIIYDKFAHTDMGFVGISDYLNKHGYTKSKYRDQEL